MHPNPTDIKDYYKILDVPEDASRDAVKRAYRELARKYHPDRNQEAAAEDQFKEIGEAYEVLKDQSKREAYDQLRAGYQHGVFRGQPEFDGGGFRFKYGPEGPGDLGDLFGTLFSGGAGPQRSGSRTSLKGSDIQARLKVSLEVAYRGGSQRITLAAAGGTRSLDVKIPAGLTQGQKIRLKGQGEPGPGGARPGNLILETEITAHSVFKLDGKDLYLQLSIAPWEAALGAKVPVRTLSGEVSLTIPKAARSGQKMRLRGRGMPGSPAGDLLIELLIQVPLADNETMRELYQQMADSGYDPRQSGD
jgi:curved DNA-binding protein